MFLARSLHNTVTHSTLKTIAVVITTYNRASVVGRAIKSVLRQTLLPNEIIVVDDGSDDNTEAAISQFMRRIRYIRTKNQGVSRSRNLAILKSTSDWICFLDSDDIWHPRKLELQNFALLLTQTRICFCRSIDESGIPLDDIDDGTLNISDPILLKRGPLDTTLLKTDRHVFIQSAFVDRNLLLECNLFDESLHVAEDTKLVYLLSLEYKYVIINQYLVGVSRKPSRVGLSENKNLPAMQTRYECYRRVQSDILNRPINFDKETQNLLERRIIYFRSRESEIFLKRGKLNESLTAAKHCFSQSSSFHVQLRCIKIFFIYFHKFIFQNKFIYCI